jgi:hypothetical protein
MDEGAGAGASVDAFVNYLKQYTKQADELRVAITAHIGNVGANARVDDGGGDKLAERMCAEVAKTGAIRTCWQTTFAEGNAHNNDVAFRTALVARVGAVHTAFVANKKHTPAEVAHDAAHLGLLVMAFLKLSREVKNDDDDASLLAFRRAPHLKRLALVLQDDTYQDSAESVNKYKSIFAAMFDLGRCLARERVRLDAAERKDSSVNKYAAVNPTNKKRVGASLGAIKVAFLDESIGLVTAYNVARIVYGDGCNVANVTVAPVPSPLTSLAKFKDVLAAVPLLEEFVNALVQDALDRPDAVNGVSAAGCITKNAVKVAALAFSPASGARMGAYAFRLDALVHFEQAELSEADIFRIAHHVGAAAEQRACVNICMDEEDDILDTPEEFAYLTSVKNAIITLLDGHVEEAYAILDNVNLSDAVVCVVIATAARAKNVSIPHLSLALQRMGFDPARLGEFVSPCKSNYQDTIAKLQEIDAPTLEKFRQGEIRKVVMLLMAGDIACFLRACELPEALYVGEATTEILRLPNARLNDIAAAQCIRVCLYGRDASRGAHVADLNKESLVDLALVAGDEIRMDTVEYAAHRRLVAELKPAKMDAQDKKGRAFYRLVLVRTMMYVVFHERPQRCLTARQRKAFIDVHSGMRDQFNNMWATVNANPTLRIAADYGLFESTYMASLTESLLHVDNTDAVAAMLGTLILKQDADDTNVAVSVCRALADNNQPALVAAMVIAAKRVFAHRAFINGEDLRDVRNAHFEAACMLECVHVTHIPCPDDVTAALGTPGMVMPRPLTFVKDNGANSTPRRRAVLGCLFELVEQHGFALPSAQTEAMEVDEDGDEKREERAESYDVGDADDVFSGDMPTIQMARWLANPPVNVSNKAVGHYATWTAVLIRNVVAEKDRGFMFTMLVDIATYVANHGGANHLAEALVGAFGDLPDVDRSTVNRMAFFLAVCKLELPADVATPGLREAYDAFNAVIRAHSASLFGLSMTKQADVLVGIFDKFQRKEAALSQQRRVAPPPPPPQRRWHETLPDHQRRVVSDSSLLLSHLAGESLPNMGAPDLDYDGNNKGGATVSQPTTPLEDEEELEQQRATQAASSFEREEKEVDNQRGAYLDYVPLSPASPSSPLSPSPTDTKMENPTFSLKPSGATVLSGSIWAKPVSLQKAQAVARASAASSSSSQKSQP